MVAALEREVVTGGSLIRQDRIAPRTVIERRDRVVDGDGVEAERLGLALRIDGRARGSVAWGRSL